MPIRAPFSNNGILTSRLLYVSDMKAFGPQGPVELLSTLEATVRNSDDIHSGNSKYHGSSGSQVVVAVVAVEVGVAAAA